MPIYEYECTECGHFEEVLQKISDPPVSECTKCHGTMKKLMSMNSFHLKGSGWYVTDYASKHGASTASSGPSSETKETGKAKDAGSPSKKASSGSSGTTAKE